MPLPWAYVTYAFAALGATAIFLALPRDGATRGRAALMLGAAALAGLLTVLRYGLGTAATTNVYFCVLTALALLAAARVITHAKPVYAALYFIVVVLSTAGLAVLAGAEFLAAALVIVYAGAILVTYVFVLMLAQQSPVDAEAADYDRTAREPGAAVLAGFVLSATLCGVIVTRHWSPQPVDAAPAGNSTLLGRELLANYAVPVELAGVLLMVAMIGALAIARAPVTSAVRSAQPTGPAEEIGRTVRPF
ncbi:MAG: NADH-quinone oxidoreductase subunit J [Phycisphaerae bacterium]